MIRAPNALAVPTIGQPQQVYYDQNGNWQWYPYATGGATRPDSFTGMTGDFRTGLERMFAEAPPEIRDNLQVYSGYRSNERQAQLWAEALAEHGSEAEARRWVAPPGRSQHNFGNAADLRYNSPEAREWAHANAANFGLAFPLSNEDWHIELATARGNAPRGNNPAPSRGDGIDYQPQQQPTMNALAVPEQERVAQMQAAQRQQALNALTASLRRPIYTNVMSGGAPR